MRSIATILVEPMTTHVIYICHQIMSLKGQYHPEKCLERHSSGQVSPSIPLQSCSKTARSESNQTGSRSIYQLWLMGLSPCLTQAPSRSVTSQSLGASENTDKRAHTQIEFNFKVERDLDYRTCGDDTKRAIEPFLSFPDEDIVFSSCVKTAKTGRWS